MQLTTDRCLAMIALAAVIGCNSHQPGTGSSTSSGTTGAAVADAGPPTRQDADQFFVALRDRTATPMQLTKPFCAAIAPPLTDEDKKLGYSQANAQEWLAQFRDTKFPVMEETKFGNAIVLRGRAEFPTKKEAFALRLVRDGNGYKVDWLQHSEHLSMGIASPADPDLAAAQDAVRNMLDLMLGSNIKDAQLLMTLDWKKRLSPLPPDAKAKDGLEYDPGFLVPALRNVVFGATAYTLSDGKLDPSRETANFVVDFEVDGKKVPHTVKATKDSASGRWLVAGFDSNR
jgi:hypothetical protein